MDAADDTRFDRLTAALQVVLQWEQAGRTEPADDLLDRNAALRDLLEPMLADRTGGGGDGRDDGGMGRLGEFELEEEIGRGAMGVVYLARQANLGRPVAIKVLPSATTMSPAVLARFRREAELVAKLDHPGIVKMLSVGECAGRHYFAMELVVAAALHRVIERLQARPSVALTSNRVVQAVLAEVETCPGSRPSGESTSQSAAAVWRDDYFDTVAEICAQIADALEHAHQHGIVHRDVKPSNVLLRADGRVVLTDFGLAREQHVPSMTRTGDFAGTPYYMAPEQALGRVSQIDRRADVFSLGVTLYELATMHRPFVGASVHEVVQQILAADPVEPRRLQPGVPRDLGAIALRALERDPGHRYQTAADLAADLRSFLARRPVRARPIGTLQRLSRWARREPFRAGFVGLAAIVVPLCAALGGYLLANRAEIAAGETAIAESRIEDLLARAFTQLGEGARPAALPLFDAALRLDPGRVEAACGRALLLLELEGPQAALQDLEPSGDLPLAKTRTWQRLRARLLHHAGRAAEARVEIEALGEPVEPGEMLLAGMEHLARGHASGEREAFAAALRAFDTACFLADGPRLPFQVLRAHAIGHLGDADLARQVARLLRRHWPGSAYARLWTAFAWQAADPVRSAEAYAEAAAADPGDAYLGFQRFRSMLAGEGPLAALAYARERLAASGDPYDRAAIAEALQQLGRGEEARREFAAVLAADHGGLPAELVARALAATGRLDEALALIEPFARGNPGEIGAAVLEIGLLRAAGRADDALRRCEARLAARPDEGRLLVELAACALAEGDRAAAVASLERAADLRGSRYAARFRLARLHAAAGDLQAAEASFRSAIAASPSSPAAHAELGVLVSGTGRWDEALELMLRARDLGDDHAELYYNLGIVRQQLGDLGGAEEAYRACLAREDLPQAQRALGCLLHSSGADAAAVEPLRRAVAAAPDDREALAYLGRALVRSGDPEGALRAIGDWLEGHPGDGGFWVELAGLRLGDDPRVRDLDEAAAALDRAGGDSTFAGALLRARLWAARGEHDRADEWFARAERLAAGDGDRARLAEARGGRPGR